MKTKFCARCGKPYKPTGTNQKYCPPCGKLVGKEQMKEGSRRHYAKVKALLAEDRMRTISALYDQLQAVQRQQ